MPPTTAPNVPSLRPPRRLAHDVVVEPPEFEDVSLRHRTRYLLAQAIGLHSSIDGHSSTVLSGDKMASRIYTERIMQGVYAGHLALLHVALNDGLSGQEAALWASRRSGADSMGEWLWECAQRFDIDADGIRPYGLFPDLRGPDRAWCAVCSACVRKPDEGWTLDQAEMALCADHQGCAASDRGGCSAPAATS